MEELENIIYSKPIDLNELKSQIQIVQQFLNDEEIDSILINACFLDHSRMNSLVPFLSPKIFDEEYLFSLFPHHDQVYLYYFFNCFHDSPITKLYEKYVHKEFRESKNILEINTNFGGQLAEIIYLDDVENLIKYSTSNSLKCNQYLSISNQLYNYEKIPLIAYAAQCGSIKCFKFLLQNENSPKKQAIPCGWDAFAFAASKEEFSLFANIDDLYSFGLLSALGQFHINYILQQIIPSPHLVEKIDSSHIEMCYNECIKWGNYSAVKWFINYKGVHSLSKEKIIY